MDRVVSEPDVELAAPAPRGRRRWLHALALVIGAIALAVLIRNTGWDTLSAALVRIGPWFGVIAAIDLCAVMCDAGVLHAFASANARVPYARVFAAQASGIAINRLTPGNALGEPLKVSMLMNTVPRSVAVSSVVMFNLATMWCAVTVILIGIPLTLLSLDLSTRAQIAIGIVAVVIAAFAIAMFVIARRGAAGTIIRGAEKLGLLSAERSARWRAAVAQVDAQIRQLGGRKARRAIACVIGSRVFYGIGSIILMSAAGIPLTAPIILANVSIGILIAWVSNVIPLGLGIADGSNYALYGALGATGGAGLLYTMVNRARTILLALMGLTVMAMSAIAFDDARRR